MSRSPSADPSAFDCALEIAAPPDEVYAGFFDPDRLRAWWQVRASVTTARTLGIYALEWPTSVEAEPLLGRLGGAFYGVVIDTRPGREFFLADAYWLPPDGDPIGPMAVHVTCLPIPVGTRLRFQQSGCDDSQRWRRFYRVIGAQWGDALARLKAQLEPSVPPSAPSA
jgi:uncharacterized protein YndB with AHSA1/START domain